MNADGSKRVSRFMLYAVASAVLMYAATLSKYYSGPGATAVRGNLGDVLVVVSLYCALRAVFPKSARGLLIAFVVCLGCSVELLQGVGYLHGGRGAVTNYWLGQRFDWWDIVSYCLGGVIAVVCERGEVA